MFDRVGKIRRNWAIRSRGRGKLSELRRRIGRAEILEARWLLSFDPSPLEQAYLEAINRMRINPQGELDVIFSSFSPLTARDPSVHSAIRFFKVDGDLLRQQWSTLTPVPPLAWNEILTRTAEDHNQWMIRADDQQHQLPGEPSLGDRVRAAGYSFRKVTENIYAYAENVIHGHAGFVVDWGDGPGGIQSPPGHRINIMDPDVVEVGIDVVAESNPLTAVGPFLVTQDFGQPRTAGQPFLLGVIWTDINNNGQYDPGEGLGNVDVTISGSSGSFTTKTWTAGGYQVRVPAGSYQVTASGPGISGPIAVANIVVGLNNVKADLERNRANRVPIANPDSATGTNVNPVYINILDNDSDPDGTLDRGSVVIVDSPRKGTAEYSTALGSIIYTPDPGTTGADQFTYLVRDNRGAASNVARVSVAIDSVNLPPLASSISAGAQEDTPVEINLTGFVTDDAGQIDWSSVQLVNPPGNGDVRFESAQRHFRYTPRRDFSGQDSFSYRVADNEGLFSLPAQVVITVNAVNDPPVATSDLAVTDRGMSVSVDVLANDVDVDDPRESLRPVVVLAPARGTATVTDRRIRYQPEAGFTGLVQWTYRAIDPSGSSSEPVAVRVYVVDPGRRWQNPEQPADVDGNDVISPLDALLVINQLGGVLTPTTPLPPFIDVNGDNQISPLDALLVINRLGNPQSPSALLAETPPENAVPGSSDDSASNRNSFQEVAGLRMVRRSEPLEGIIGIPGLRPLVPTSSRTFSRRELASPTKELKESLSQDWDPGLVDLVLARGI